MDPTTTDSADPGTDRVDDFLAHFGTKGMRWGVRKAAKNAVKTAREEKKAAKSGGTPYPKSGGTPAGRLGKPKGPVNVTTNPNEMTDAQLRSAINRIQMQRQYAQLTALPPSRMDKAKALVAETLVDVGKTQGKALLNAYVKKTIEDKTGLQLGGGKGKKDKTKEKEADATPEDTTPTPKPAPTPRPAPTPKPAPAPSSTPKPKAPAAGPIGPGLQLETKARVSAREKVIKDNPAAEAALRQRAENISKALADQKAAKAAASESKAARTFVDNSGVLELVYNPKTGSFSMP